MGVDMRNGERWPSWPRYGAREIDAAARVVASQQLFAAGEVKAFEADFADYLGSSYAVGVGNATQGLHLALAALGVGRDDEVIVTASSWISTASCILMQNAVPVFVDIEPESLGIDPSQVGAAITERTKGVILMHNLGYPAKVKQVHEVARSHGLFLVEDAAHAPGAEVGGQKCGTFGDLSVFSLHQRKTISTGDGGVICTDDALLAEKLRRLRSFGDEELSYNYRMTEFSGALGRLGLERLDEENQQRRDSAQYLRDILSGESWIKARLCRDGEVGAYFGVALEVDLRDDLAQLLLSRLTEMGYPMRSAFPPLNRHPHFSNPSEPPRGYPWLSPTYPKDGGKAPSPSMPLPVAYEYCYGRILELYAYPGVTRDQLDEFAEAASSARESLPESSARAVSSP